MQATPSDDWTERFVAALKRIDPGLAGDDATAGQVALANFRILDHLDPEQAAAEFATETTVECDADGNPNLRLGMPACPTVWELRLEVQGATRDDLVRGVKAAHDFFESQRVSAWQGAFGYWKRDAAQGAFMDKLEHAWAHAWEGAESAANEACCADWPVKALRAELALWYPEQDESRAQFAARSEWVG